MKPEPLFVGLVASVCLVTAVQPLACRTEKSALGCGACPAAPASHVNDLAGLMSAAAQAQLDRQLAVFEGETGDEIVLHTAPELPEGTILEDYTLTCANCWAASREKPRNVVIFLFRRQRKVRIEVSRALEKQLTNQYCRQVIQEMVPYFRNGEFEKGLQSGTLALLRALRE
jgi:uncharacterized protein